MTLDLAALRKLSEAATPGPFAVDHCISFGDPNPETWPVERPFNEMGPGLQISDIDCIYEADAHLVCSLLNNIGPLLDLVESQAAEVGRLTQLCDSLEDQTIEQAAEIEPLREIAGMADALAERDRQVAAVLDFLSGWRIGDRHAEGSNCDGPECIDCFGLAVSAALAAGGTEGDQ